MKRLYLLRHAKSSWDDTSLADHDRPLNARGRRAAAFMGSFMVENDLTPDLIICSSALRARETLSLLFLDDTVTPNCRVDGLVYEAGTNTLRILIAEIDDEAASVLLIGHNPGIESLINYLTGHLEPMPTATLAVIDLFIEKWQQIDVSTGNLDGVYRPRVLMGE